MAIQQANPHLTNILDLATKPTELNDYFGKLNGTQLAEVAKHLETLADETLAEQLIELIAEYIHNQINQVSEPEQQITFIRQYFAAHVSDSAATVASQAELDLLKQKPRPRINVNPNKKAAAKKDKPSDALPATIEPVANISTTTIEPITESNDPPATVETGRQLETVETGRQLETVETNSPAQPPTPKKAKAGPRRKAAAKQPPTNMQATQPATQPQVELISEFASAAITHE